VEVEDTGEVSKVDAVNAVTSGGLTKKDTFSRRAVLAGALGWLVGRKLVERPKTRVFSEVGHVGGVLLYDEGFRHLVSVGSQSGVFDQTELRQQDTRGLRSSERNVEYPLDVLSRQELKDFNVEISSTSSDIDLLVRKGALSDDPLFKKLVESKSRYETEANNPALRAKIILVDTGDLFTDCPVPSEYRAVWRNSVNSLKQRGAKGAFGIFYELLEWAEDDPGWNIKDRQTNRTLKGEEAKHGTYYIFLAVGENRRPNLKQSFVSPQQLLPQGSANISKEYVVEDANRTPGFVLRHELFHSINSDELKTDMRALKGVSDAYDLWLKTGDTSKYYLVFKTPEGPVYARHEREDDVQKV